VGLIDEKNQWSKISWDCLFKYENKFKIEKKRDPEIFIETLDWMESVRLWCKFLSASSDHSKNICGNIFNAIIRIHLVSYIV
jgi:hypothetical protein